MKRSCNKCRWIREYEKGKHYGAGEWMCQKCLDELTKENN